MEAINFKQLQALIPFDPSFERREDNPRFKSIARALLRSNGYYSGSGYNPHNVRVWKICNEFGLCALAIGGHIEETLDNAANNDCLLAEHVPYDELDEEQLAELHDDNGCGVTDLTPLGNAGELYSLMYVMAYPIELE